MKIAAFSDRLRDFLEGAKCNRYITNSYEYYSRGDLHQVAEDKYYIMTAPPLDLQLFLEENKALHEEILDSFGWLDAHLGDVASRELLVTVAAYRLLGHRYVAMPYVRQANTMLKQALIQATRQIDTLDVTAIDLLHRIYPHNSFGYGLFDLHPAGGSLKFYALDETVYQYFFQRGYEYHGPELDFTVGKGDVVIDCGCCIGDYSVIFAEQAGQGGHVVCIDPVPAHLAMTEKNFALNPQTGCAFTLVHGAVWNKDKEALHLGNAGPGTTIVSENTDELVQSKTIDTIIKELKLPRVDFIKMDIEGAELAALHGSQQSIKKFRPKLAISLYHNVSDFKEITKFIDQLKLGYRFFLQHHYVNSWETVLYAAPPALFNRLAGTSCLRRIF